MNAKRTPVLALVLSGMLGVCGGAAHADSWGYNEENLVAQVKQSGYTLRVHCADHAEIVVVYSIPTDDIPADLKKRKSAYLVITPDQDSSGHGHAYVFSSKVIPGDTTYLIGLGGPDALKMADKFAEVTDNITVGVSVKKPAGAAAAYDVTSFPAEGAIDTVPLVQVQCPGDGQ